MLFGQIVTCSHSGAKYIGLGNYNVPLLLIGNFFIDSEKGEKHYAAGY